jgi:hypothetical protein
MNAGQPDVPRLLTHVLNLTGQTALGTESDLCYTHNDPIFSVPYFKCVQHKMGMWWIIGLVSLWALGVQRWCTEASWIPRDVYQSIIAEFETLEVERSKIHFRGTDKRSSTPFITGNGFRNAIKHETHICEESNRCRVTPEAITNGSCVYVVSDSFEYFVKEVVPRIPGPYRIISHNGDLSTPDGQNDAPRIGMSKYVTSDILQREYEAGRLLAHHGQNLWWHNKSFSPRPVWAHCIPIGFENRQWTIGKNLHVYIRAIEEYILNKPNLTLSEQDKKSLLLIAFYPKSRVPDREKVLRTLGNIPPKGQSKPTNTWYNETDLSHVEWLAGVTEHRFVLAPFGHGLDTHRYEQCCFKHGFCNVSLSPWISCASEYQRF